MYGNEFMANFEVNLHFTYMLHVFYGIFTCMFGLNSL